MAGLVEEIVSVVVDGWELTGFEEVDVRRSMQNAAIAFTLKATHAAQSDPAKKLRSAEELEIYTSPASGTRSPGGGDLLCTGGVDEYDADIGEQDKKSVTLHGRSHARDAIDCQPVDHPTGRVENKNLLEAARDLGGEFALDWSSDIPLDAIAKIQRRPGETLFQTIERQASIEGLMLLGQPDGGILITKAGTKRHAGTLVVGQPPVNRVSIKLAPGMERSQIVVRGQRATGYGADNLRQEERVTTGGKRRHRPHEDLVEGDRYKSKLRGRGDWRRLRGFQGNAIQVRVSRWRDDNGLLWEPGRLMAIQVPDEDIDSDFLLSEVTFRQGQGEDAGTRAELVFVDPQDYGGTAPMTGTDNAGGDEFFDAEEGA